MNRIKAFFTKGSHKVRTEPLWRYDYGQILVITGLELPENYEVHFSNSPEGTATTSLGNSEGVTIPDIYLTKGDVYAWLYLHTGESDGETVYQIDIPVRPRAAISNQPPTPVQQDVITQTIAALDAAVDEAEAIAESIPGRIDEAFGAITAQAETLQPGSPATASFENKVLTIGVPEGQKGDPGEDGKDGKDGKDGADGFSPTATVSKVGSTATITITDKTGTTTAQLTDGQDGKDGVDGKDGQDGQDGFSPTATVTKSGDTATITITDKNGTTTANVSDGQDGVTPNVTAGTTTTGEAGTNASVTRRSGSPDSAPIFDFVIPKGDKGDPGEVTEAELLAGLATKAPIIEDSVESSAVASFPDGADKMPMKVSVTLNPKQDLHGQDAPYPAGGGKNLIPYPYYESSGTETNGITFTVDSDGVVTANGTATATSEFRLITQIQSVSFPAGTYTLSGLPSDATSSTIVYNTYAGNEVSNDLWDTRVYTDRTFTVSSEIKFLYIGIRILSGYTANNVKFKPQFESGSTATPYAPYSNICPIYGRTGCDVNRTGVNVWDEETESGYINSDGTYGYSDTALRSKNYCSCVPNTEYRFVKPSGYSVTPNICWYDANKTFISRSATQEFPSITSPSNAYFFKISMWNYGATYNNDISINYPSTDHDYHAYTGNTYPISWQTEAGTVYGGTLTVNKDGTGTLVVDRENIASYNGEALPSTWISDRDVYAQGTTPTTGAQVVYKLATPVTYNLTDLEVIETLKGGVNNVWSDGGNCAVEYYCNTKLYIDKKIASLGS